MADTPAKKPAPPADLVRREVSAMSRILGALRTLPTQRRKAVMDYLNGLLQADTLDRLEQDPPRPGA